MAALPIPSIYTAILAQARMAPHEVAVIGPTEKITVMDRLPRNEMGKVLRLELAAQHPAA